MRSGVVLLALLAVGLASGCGLGSGAEREGGAELRVTSGFGRVERGSASLPRVREDQTVMRFLRSKFDVETRFGGGFVQSIDGLAGKGAGGRRDWFYFVNGIEAEEGAGAYELSPGDRVQWDFRLWKAAMRVPAIVGAFPEPLKSGLHGKRFPVRVECEDERSRACRDVKARLGGRGVPVSGASLGASGTRNVLRVVVARWRRARLVRAAASLQRGPGVSGVFARFAADGRALELLDERGRLARRVKEGDGTGLVAATRPTDEEIVWIVTALDEAGLERAAGALDERTLAGAYAVAVTGRGAETLPLRKR